MISPAGSYLSQMHRFRQAVGVKNSQAAFAEALAAADRFLNAGGSGAGKNEHLHMAENLGSQGLIGNVLVITAGDNDQFLIKGPKSGDGTGGAGGDGIVIPFDTIEFPDELDAGAPPRRTGCPPCAWLLWGHSPKQR